MKLQQNNYKITDTLVEEICIYIEENYGIKITGINASRLLNYLKKLPSNIKPKDILAKIDNDFQKIFLNNESYFFRHNNQLNFILKIANKNTNLKILSIGCSKGQEVYSLSIVLNQKMAKFHITGIDMDASSIEHSKKGLYDEQSIRLDNDQIDKYFKKINNQYIINDKYKNNTNFLNMSILDNDERLENESFDIILCNNVLIYYNEVNLEKITNKIYNLLKPNGLLLTTEEETYFNQLLEKFIMKTDNNFKYFIKPITAYEMEYRELFEHNNQIKDNSEIYNTNDIYITNNKNALIEIAGAFYSKNDYINAFKYYYKLLNLKFEETYLLRMVSCLENIGLFEEAKKWQYTYLLSTIPNEFQIKKYMDLCIKTKDFDEYEKTLLKLNSL